MDSISVESSFVFWVDPKTSSLNRIRRDLTGRQIIVEDDMNSVESIAVDWMAGQSFIFDLFRFVSFQIKYNMNELK